MRDTEGRKEEKSNKAIQTTTQHMNTCVYNYCMYTVHVQCMYMYVCVYIHVHVCTIHFIHGECSIQRAHKVIIN